MYLKLKRAVHPNNTRTWPPLSVSQQKEMDGAVVMLQEAMDQVRTSERVWAIRDPSREQRVPDLHDRHKHRQILTTAFTYHLSIRVVSIQTSCLICHELQP